MPNPYYNHYAKLVAGIALLLVDNLTPQEVERAQDLLDEFYKPIIDLYGKTIVYKRSTLLPQISAITLHLQWPLALVNFIYVKAE